MPAGLPASPQALEEATWADILPFYQELVARPLAGDGRVEAWLSDWSRLDELVFEASTLASIAYTTDTQDPAKEAAHLRFSSQIIPRLREQQALLSRRLVELGYVREGIEMTVKRFRNLAELYREENVPLLGELSKLGAEYQKVTGGMTVEWDGEEKTLPQLLPFLQSPDRAVRERAFRLRARPYIEQRARMADIFDRQYPLRQQVARNAGFENYRDYTHQEKNRFDYRPADCERFHAAVEEVFLPALARVHRRWRDKLGVAELRPWDLDADPDGRPPVRPFSTASELVSTANSVFAQVSPEFGDYFGVMAREGLLDLESRKGKAPGAYCATLPHRKRPFLFLNVVGIDRDVNTLLHESGHAFHSFEASRLPLVFQRFPGSEMAEVASMSMELLAAPYLGRDAGGFFGADDHRRMRLGELERILAFFPHCASVDAFQHWIYTSGEGDDRDARDAAWLRLRRRFETAEVAWEGLEPEQVARWYQQLHIFLSPFYYIEYGIAQLGALQVWRNALRDQESAVRSYRAALALGGTRPLPELFGAAGARLIFDAAGMRELVAVVEQEIELLEAPAG